ncbi:hypothetical protein Tco_0766126 [Tanacetum coccineum]
MAEDDHRLRNLKFVPKGKEDEVFGMQIPKELITDNIRNASYYNVYLEMSKKPATAKQPKPVSFKQSKPAPAKQPKPVKEKSTKPSPVKKAGKGKVRKVRKGKSSLQLVNEPDEEPQQALEPQIEDEEYDLQRGIQISLEYFQAHGQAPVGRVAIHEPIAETIRQLLVVEGKGKGIATDEQAALSLLDLHKPKKKVRDTPSPTDADTSADTDKTNSKGDTEILNIGEEQREDVANKAGPNPRQSHVALAGPDPEPMHDDFVATMYPQVHESLKHPNEEHVHLENPLSSTGTLSSLKNLDNFTFGDQFIADKSPEDEPRNANMETKVESMVTVPIHQASSSVPPLSTPVIDLTPPKPVLG